jgi:hypothetical protein
MKVVPSIEARLGSFVGTDDRWVPRPWPRGGLVAALLDGAVAGVEVSHPMEDVLWKIERLCGGDPHLQLGISTVRDAYSAEEVLELVSRAAGFTPTHRWGPVAVDPELVLDACEAVGERLAAACRRRERVLLATGHPTGLPILYGEIGRLLRDRGATLLKPLDGAVWRGGHHGTRRSVQYMEGVATLTIRSRAVHTHSPEAMQHMLEPRLGEDRPDLVFADHGFAGAAIEAGIQTLAIADVNDPALVVAGALGLSEAVIVMDDNVAPETYWPCFQAIAARMVAD